MVIGFWCIAKIYPRCLMIVDGSFPRCKTHQQPKFECAAPCACASFICIQRPVWIDSTLTIVEISTSPRILHVGHYMHLDPQFASHALSAFRATICTPVSLCGIDHWRRAMLKKAFNKTYLLKIWCFLCPTLEFNHFCNASFVQRDSTTVSQRVFVKHAKNAPVVSNHCWPWQKHVQGPSDSELFLQPRRMHCGEQGRFGRETLTRREHSAARMVISGLFLAVLLVFSLLFGTCW